MTGSRTRPAILLAGLLLGLLAVSLQGVQGEELEKVPSEDQCRPYIEKALKDLGTEGEHADANADGSDEGPGEESAADTNENDEESGSRVKRDVSAEAGDDDGDDKTEENENEVDQDQVETVEIASVEDDQVEESAQAADEESAADSKEDDDKTQEAEGEESQEAEQAGEGDGDSAEGKTEEEQQAVADEESEEQVDAQEDVETNEIDDSNDEKDDSPADNVESDEQKTAEEEDGKSEEEQAESAEAGEGADETVEDTKSVEEEAAEEQKEESKEEEATEEQQGESKEEEAAEESNQEESKEDDKKSVEEEEVVAEAAASVEAEPDTAEAASEEAKEGEDDGKSDEKEASGETKEEDAGKSEEGEGEAEGEGEGKSGEEGDGKSGEDGEGKSGEEGEGKSVEDGEGKSGEEDEAKSGEEGESEESRPEEEELIMEIEIPEILRPRDHIDQLLKLDEDHEDKEKAVEKIADVVLRDLKRLYDNAIKPLETLYKYRDLSNRHFGDPEIFSKPLVLFMGPWSGGKSSIINYLLDIEYKPTSLRTGAEPSPAYFNILMHGEEDEVLDGTQLAADWTFSGLQKFGQGLLDRLKGFKLKNKLLEKVNIVEIPGILEIRKQVQRLFPFNDACQWFIDRADIIFLVYDPSKLDVGPETEAILDQLKGREYQTRIILNKADQVKPEELMRVQGALIWNISPLMSSAEPPIMYSTSLWSIPYEAGAPTRLLYAQERAFLRDLRSAVDKRVEHKIASARRFAVRVRNHAKMVDCYLTTYYNHKSFFAKKKDTSDRIIENPQDYHIYEGLSTLTNISRYDLPDPDVYRDFFRLNPLYDFPLLSSTCTYFRGCPINRLDVAIAYDLPELVGKYRKAAEAALHQGEEAEAAPTPAPVTQQSTQKPTARSGASRISLS